MRPFGRVVLAAIGQAGANGAGLLGFRTSFDVAYSGTSAPGTATIRVWNVPDSVILLAMAGPLPSIMVTAGHNEADTGAPIPALPLFTGDVSEFTIRRDGVDHVFEAIALSAGVAWQRARFVYTTPSPTAYPALVALAVAQAGLVLRGLVPFLVVPLPHGFYWDGSFRDFMNAAAAAMGCRWKVDGVFVDVWPSSLPNPSGFSAVFDPTNTIGEPKVKKNKIEIRALLNGKIRPGSLFTVIGLVGAGTYIAQDVSFIGDSGFDAAFYVDVIGRVPGT